MANEPANYIVWIDCEMTGLNPEIDELVEIAIILTDFSLKPLHAGFRAVIAPNPTALANMNSFVQNMHETSGLLAEMENGATLADAQQQAIDYIKAHGTDPDKLPLVAGNTIGMDRRFINKYMPELDEILHYRSIDVSTIKELSRRWHTPAFQASPTKHGGHRALADIAESIRELAYLRDTVLVPTPGPSLKDATSIAEKTTVEYTEVIAASQES